MTQIMGRLESSVHARRSTDVPLLTWWVYYFIASPFTLGVYGLYTHYKRMSRIDGFVDRKLRYYSSVLEWTRLYASRNGQLDAVDHRIRLLRDDVMSALKPFHAGRNLVLVFVTLGLWGLVAVYRLNQSWHRLQHVEARFYDGLNPVWQQLELVQYPLHFEIDPSKKRSFALYLLLIPVTLGIWGLVWDNRLHHDPNNLYPEIHGLEDTIVQTIRQASPSDARPALRGASAG